jgi:hypothetical protein
MEKISNQAKIYRIKNKQFYLQNKIIFKKKLIIKN